MSVSKVGVRFGWNTRGGTMPKGKRNTGRRLDGQSGRRTVGGRRISMMRVGESGKVVGVLIGLVRRARRGATLSYASDLDSGQLNRVFQRTLDP